MNEQTSKIDIYLLGEMNEAVSISCCSSTVRCCRLHDGIRPIRLRIASRVGERTTVLEVGRITHFFSKDKLTLPWRAAGLMRSTTRVRSRRASRPASVRPDPPRDDREPQLRRGALPRRRRHAHPVERRTSSWALASAAAQAASARRASRVRERR